MGAAVDKLWGMERRVSPAADRQCLAGAETTGEPGARFRGGFFLNGSDAGPLTVSGGLGPSFAFDGVGFRCAR